MIMENRAKVRGFEVVGKEFLKSNKDVSEVLLPKRGTQHSAGYDVISPVDVTVKAGEQVLIWTDVKAYMQYGEVLMAFPRSSYGVKFGIMLANTVGIIDADYFSNKSNDGNIAICLKNTSDKDLEIKRGDAVAQLIFMPYLVSDNCNTDEVRIGGIGSTGK